ncbi:uncharacterized protein LOC117588649 [Drosophila guanche]|uniref:uncharacterized protein LOC117588649 n=1 Tax=Drosophila guanche TaxID=7266 RepID=UPI001470EF0C|nr:uncharacterized protein LOC117588649 [Drosophila guanche]
MADDRPFNPFYIGPHPSRACAIPEIPGQQCNPACGSAPSAEAPNVSSSDQLAAHPTAQEAAAAAAAEAEAAAATVSIGTAAPGQSLSATAAAPILVTGGAKPVAVLVARTLLVQPGTSDPANCQTYPCMEAKHN